jgi:hypothetical protein
MAAATITRGTVPRDSSHYAPGKQGCQAVSNTNVTFSREPHITQNPHYSAEKQHGMNVRRRPIGPPSGSAGTRESRESADLGSELPWRGDKPPIPDGNGSSRRQEEKSTWSTRFFSVARRWRGRDGAREAELFCRPLQQELGGKKSLSRRTNCSKSL